MDCIGASIWIHAIQFLLTTSRPSLVEELLFVLVMGLHSPGKLLPNEGPLMSSWNSSSAPSPEGTRTVINL